MPFAVRSSAMAPRSREQRLPVGLRDTIAAASGQELADVRVHLNSREPAAIGALAFARRSEIHLGPGQEHLLAHEAWHVVQQRSGRVPVTAHRSDGTPMNLDPVLEREADGWPSGSKPALQASGAAGDWDVADVLQGMFAYRGQPAPDGPHLFVDLESNRLYQIVRAGPPDERTKQSTWAIVRRPDGLTLSIRMSEADGGWVLSDEESAEQRAVRMGAAPYVPPDTARPTMVRTDSFELGVTEHTPPAPRFEQGSGMEVEAIEVAEQQLVDADMRIARLGTQFTVQVAVQPIAQGRARLDPSGLPDHLYTAEQVAAATLAVGDKDRADTYLEPKESGGGIPQGRHTVAWALVRQWIGGLSGQTVAAVLDTLIHNVDAMKPLLRGDEPQHLLGAVNWDQSISLLRNGELPIDRWQANLSELLRWYVQLYHLCGGALFAGTSKQRGESPATKAFATCEASLASGQGATHKPAALAKHAADLLDINFTIPAETYAFALSHFLTMLVETYPNVMRKFGATITRPLLDKKLSPKYPDTWELGPIRTVHELLSHFGNEEPDFEAAIAPPKVSGTLDVTPFQLEKYKSSFVADVNVVPIDAGPKVMYPVTFGSTTITTEVAAYKVRDLLVGTVLLSDADRPQTRYGRTQNSHTVAWTLVRHDLMAYQHAPLSQLMTFLDKSFRFLATDVAISEGREIVAKAQGALVDLDKRTMPVHDWQAFASMLTTWYALAYQLSKSATFHDPRTARPEGHSEAIHRRVMERNERALVNHRELIDAPTRVVAAATKLFDAYVPHPGVSQSVSSAFEHWLDALRHTYPQLMAVGEAEIVAEIKRRNISTASAPVNLGTVLTPAWQ